MKERNKRLFLVVGPQRTGTTWLYDYLKRSGQVNIPLYVKETGYFDERFSEGKKWYLEQFGDISNNMILVDVSTKYLTSSIAIENVKKSFPTATIVIVHRDPCERLLSLYHHLINAENKRYHSVLQALKDDAWLTETSLYGKYTNKWVEAFGRENVHILDHGLLSDNNAEYRSCINKLFRIERFSGDDREVIINARITGLSTIVGRITGVIVPCLRNLVGERKVLTCKESRFGQLVVQHLLNRNSASKSTTPSKNSALVEPELSYFLEIIGDDYDTFVKQYLPTSGNSKN